MNCKLPNSRTVCTIVIKVRKINRGYNDLLIPEYILFLTIFLILANFWKKKFDFFLCWNLLLQKINFIFFSEYPTYTIFYGWFTDSIVLLILNFQSISSKLRFFHFCQPIAKIVAKMVLKLQIAITQKRLDLQRWNFAKLFVAIMSC